MAELPYLTEQQIRDKYAQQLTDYTNQRTAEANRAKAEAEASYNTGQRQNYINYMQSQKSLPEDMARLGITGGASETSALRNKTNYENNFNNAKRTYDTNVNNINNTLADTLNTYRMTADQAMNEEIAQNAQLRAQYEKQLQQEAEQRFANTISGYDSISGIDKEIEKIKKSGVDLWKIEYLRARRAELAAAYSGGGGGYSYSGGGGGYTYTDNSGGGGGGDNAAATRQAVANYFSNGGKIFTGKNSTGGTNKSTSGTTKTSTGRTAYYKNRTSGASYRNSKKSRDYSWRRR